MSNFKVGQRWSTREGGWAEILYIRPNELVSYPLTCIVREKNGTTFIMLLSSRGCNSYYDGKFDLITLIPEGYTPHITGHMPNDISRDRDIQVLFRCGMESNQRRIPEYFAWKDRGDFTIIGWKYADEKQAPKPHKHAALIKQWADDPSLDVWFWSSASVSWESVSSPSWKDEVYYALGNKPTEPPEECRKNTIKCNGFYVRAPLTEPLKKGDEYFIPSFDTVPMQSQKLMR